MTPPLKRPDCVTHHASLAPLTSWQVGGPADILALPRTLAEAKEAVRYSARAPISVLGGGTNVLVSDAGAEGLVLGLGKLTGATATIEGGVHRIECWAGTPKSELLKIYLKAKLEPALFLAGIPGDVGGGVAMNAGVGEMIRPREFVELVEWIDVLRFDSAATIERIEWRALNWSYRRCEGWGPGAIVRVGLAWPNEPAADVLERVREANRVRLSKQPLDLPSCGSVFRNPPGEKAGQLIEACGLKGFAVGGAKVSDKHANFIVNVGGATAADLRAVMRHVQATVKARRGIELHAEVAEFGRAQT